MYGLSGERQLIEWEVPWLPGYQGAAPVRVGNAASAQLQLDVCGELIDANTISDDFGQSLRAREAEAIFEARTLSTASPATMRRVRCIPDGTKVPRTGHIDMRTSGWRAAQGCDRLHAAQKVAVGRCRSEYDRI